jgi:hypothetical protein
MKRALSALLVVWTWTVPAAAFARQPEPAALVIGEGSLARRQVVALGRDLIVEGQALSDVAAIDGSVRVSGEVRGDVIVMGGMARLESTAIVEGDVFVLGGSLLTDEGARIDGRAVSYPTFSAAWLTLLEGPTLAGSATSPVILGAKLALLAAWALLALLLMAVSSREIRRTSEKVREEPFHCFLVGLTGILALFLTGLFFSSFAAVVIGVPLLVLVLIAALVLKFWGMVAIFHASGAWICSRIGLRRPSALHCALVGLAVLGVVKLIPFVGVWVWTAATFVGVGAAFKTKFGRLEPWFQDSPRATLTPPG